MPAKKEESLMWTLPFQPLGVALWSWQQKGGVPQFQFESLTVTAEQLKAARKQWPTRAEFSLNKSTENSKDVKFYI